MHDVSMMSLVMLELENFISLIDVFSDVVPEGYSQSSSYDVAMKSL